MALPHESLAQRLTPDERDHVPEEPVGLARVDQGEDVGMVQPGGEPDFIEKPLSAEHGADVRPQHLDRHLAIVLRVAREVHGRHPTLADHPLDGVAVAECGLKAGEQIEAHGSSPEMRRHG